MLKREDSGGATWARACDTCRSASATVYCRPDSAYLCNGCDARIHAANKVASRHERVWVCEACERAPAAFLCKADAASLCTTCDSDIHSANPLAHRHHRVPVLPLPAALYGNHVTDPMETMIGVNNSAGDVDDRGFLAQDVDETVDDHTDEDEAASWLLPNPVKNNGQGNNNNNGMLFGAGGEDVDGYLDLVEYNSCHDNHYSTGGAHDFVYHSQQQQFSVPQKSYGGDSVVPIRPDAVGKDQLHLQQQHQIYQFGLEYEASNATGYGYSASMSHSMSMSSMDCGIVPESTSSDVSVPHRRAPKGTIGPFSSAPVQMPQQLPPMDREARVLRYREKKKTRKFEKTIRYASRKAYAETRPRVKGRFAKRTDAEVDVEVDQMLSTALMMDSGGYGIVPSF